METINQELWVDKYRPKKLDDYVLNEELKSQLKAMVAKGTVQNCAFLGIQGMGKTTLAKILCNEVGAQSLFIACATEGTIDVLRTKIQEFCDALSFEGKLKVIVLDELDSASTISGSGSGFQSGLRTLIESAQDDCRFIVTGNYANKIIPAVLSRCPVIPLKFEKKDLLLHVKKILDAEHVAYTRDDVKLFIDEAFQYYPDCRRIVNYLQFCCSSGKLVVNLSKVADAEKNELVDALASKIKSCSNILDIRKFYLAEKSKIVDYVELGSDLYKHAIDTGLVVDLDGILKMTDLLYQLNMVIDKESGFFGLVTAIVKWSQKR